MSLLLSIRLSLAAMGFLQLTLAFAALLAYSLSIGASLSQRGRLFAALVACLSAIGFAAAAPQWTDGLLLLVIGIAGFGLFAGSTWLLAHLIGVGDTRGRLAADTAFVSGAARVSSGSRGRWHDMVAVVPGGLRRATAPDTAARIS